MVRLFTTPACPYCYSLKEFFKDKNIKFKEVDVASDEKGRKEMVEKSGQLGAPVVEINGEYIVGFDREKIVKALKIKD
ncbi:MAG: glutaredoxin domain-containing protein [Candidatus Nealsonbacteria bacterium]